MKRYVFSVLLACSFISGFAQESAEAKRQRMEWFKDAKLGIFIHWGIYSVNGIDESWSFFNGYLPYPDYMKQLNGFTAAKYDPAQWASLIKESGAKYAVITTKHHDGVALWDSKCNDLTVVKQTPAKRDLIAPFVKELKNNGLKTGLYFSLLDWSHPDYPNHTRTVTRYTNDSMRFEKFVNFNFCQLEELSKLFKPDLFWFDGDWEQSAEKWHAKELSQKLRIWNPGVILNSRIQGYGDYATPEQGVPVTKPSAEHWELCMTSNESWGYQHNDHDYKTIDQLLRIYVDCISMGGNLLLDIGPKPDGTIPQEQIDLLRELGRWNSKHKEAVYGTRAGIPKENFYGQSATNKEGDIIYLYIPYKPNGPLMIKGLKNTINRIWVVGNGTKLNWKISGAAYWSSVPGLVFIDVPDKVLDEKMTVIAVLVKGKAEFYKEAGQVIESN